MCVESSTSRINWYCNETPAGITCQWKSPYTHAHAHARFLMSVDIRTCTLTNTMDTSNLTVWLVPHDWLSSQNTLQWNSILTPSRQVNTYGYLIIAATLFEPEQTLNQFKSPAIYDEAVVSIFTVNQTLHTATPNKNSISITSFQKKLRPFMPRK